MSDTKTANEIKRRVTAHATDLARQPARLGIAEHDGILWATNRYWITPAARVAPLLEQYNLNADAPGAFEVNSTVRKHDDSSPDVGHFIGDLASYPEPVAPVRLGGREAHVSRDRGQWLAVHQTAGGTLMGLPADDLAWLADISGMQYSRRQVFELGPDDRFGDIRIMSKGHGGAAVLLVADVIRTLKPASYSTERDEHGRQEYIPAETENLGPRVIGALMAVKLGD